MKPPRDRRGPPGGSGPHRGPGHPRPDHRSDRREPGRGGPGQREPERGGGKWHPRPAPPPRPPETPRGTVWLYGQHAVAAALANPARRLRRLLLTEEAATALAERLSPPWAIPHETVERGRLDHLLGRDVVHQGVALLADPLGTPSLQHALERPGPVVVLDQVTDPRNVGAILRSAAAFGASAVIAQERNAPEETGALAKAASGALETVPLLRAVNIARTLVALKAAGVWVVGLDAGGAAPLSGPALAGRRAGLVLGAEGTGLRRLTRETCDELAKLAMPGAMESLNVSAAAAIALYEVTRQP
jgi:23S rRNA (guanosine2251-2'-O)-methyltransferase